ncbi:MAG: hypothetical protein EP344_02900 [Bacteroidetes bacterium]|nr:MAG: hypothetical protein EP344_02900 [Bacteroidota bacterium]
MFRYTTFLLTLLFLLVQAVAFPQASNKSKSKDRYREKTMPSEEAVQEAADQFGAFRALAEQELRPITNAVSEVLLQDKVNGPAASRVLAYSLLAGYETTARYQRKVSSLHDLLPGMPMMLTFMPADSVFYPFASLYAILETAKSLVPSGYLLTTRQQALEQSFLQRGLPAGFIQYSKTAGQDIARLVLQYAAFDGYVRLNDYPPYQAVETPDVWKPAGFPAIEPYWGTLRTFFLQSAQEYMAPAPLAYSTAADSPYPALVREVYDTGRNLNDVQRAVAAFWACDPFISTPSGYSRLTPAARWMNICGLVCEQQRTPFINALTVHTILGLGMADAYINTWDAKYRNRRIRPEQAIHQLIDGNWSPLLPSPMSPEYTSEQAAVSTAAAEILSVMIGPNIGFIDNSEIARGVQPRQYTSFRHAAEEAAWSGLYAGTQFRDGIQIGINVGRQIGLVAVRKWPAGQ